MQKINYQKELDEIIFQLQKEKKVPSLMLHSCCAPCSSYVIEYLSEYFNITVFYFNPNIYPDEEYTKRRDEQKKFIDALPTKYPVKFIGTEHSSQLFYDKVKGFEKEKEGFRRCEICFNLRLRETADIAEKHNANYFTTTLSISPLKNAQLINKIGKDIATGYNVEFLPADFKKKNGYKRSTELSRQYNIYRQNYCGCVFSKTERKEQQPESGNHNQVTLK